MIDAHVHLWDPERLRYPWLAGSPLERRFVAAHLRAATPMTTEFVAVQADCDPAESVAEVRWLAEQFAGTANLLGIVAHAPLELGSAACPLIDAVLAAGPVVGIRRLLQDEPADFVARTDFDAGLEQLTKHGLAFDLCVRPPQWNHVVELVRRHPDQQFVLDHLGKPPVGDNATARAWRSFIRKLAATSSVSCKLSGLASELVAAAELDDTRPYLAYALEMFGPDRCLFGSDWPVLTGYASYSDWFDLVGDALRGYSPRERAAVFIGTATHIYRTHLPAEPHAAISEDTS